MSLFDQWGLTKAKERLDVYSEEDLVEAEKAAAEAYAEKELNIWKDGEFFGRAWEPFAMKVVEKLKEKKRHKIAKAVALGGVKVGQSMSYFDWDDFWHTVWGELWTSREETLHKARHIKKRQNKS